MKKTFLLWGICCVCICLTKYYSRACLLQSGNYITSIGLRNLTYCSNVLAWACARVCTCVCVPSRARACARVRTCVCARAHQRARARADGRVSHVAQLVEGGPHRRDLLCQIRRRRLLRCARAAAPGQAAPVSNRFEIQKFLKHMI